MNERYQLILDQSLCSGMGDCIRYAPHIFELAPDGTARLLAGVSDDPAVLDAVRSCPMAAISAYRETSGVQVA